MLARLEGFVAALLGSLDADALAAVSSDLASFEQSVLSHGDLRAVLSDTSIPGAARGRVVGDLLADKVHPAAVRLAVYAAIHSSAPEVPHSIAALAQAARVLVDTGHLDQGILSLMDARKRVGGFADAVLEEIDVSEFAAIEGQLFAWARTIESNQELRRLLVDRDAPLDSRVGATETLLGSKVSTPALRLAIYVVVGGRPRDVVGTLDFLVDYVARARDWRVARVHAARPLDDAGAAQLVAALTTLTGHSVELQVVQEPDLLGGILVEVGDLRLDATTRGRLGALHDDVASGHLYQSALTRND